MQKVFEIENQILKLKDTFEIDRHKTVKKKHSTYPEEVHVDSYNIECLKNVHQIYRI